MNQKQTLIQKEKAKEQRIIDKGFTLSKLNHVRQTISNPNIFTVRSQISPKFYRVLVDCDLDIITCDCKYFQTKAETCIFRLVFSD